MLLAAITISNVGAAGVKMEAGGDCGLWLEARKARGAEILEGYVMGKIDGLAEGAWIDIWRYEGKKINRQQLYYWMDEYCRTNPLSSLLTGLNEFTNQVTNGEYQRKHQKIRAIK